MITLNYPVILSRRSSTAVSLETYPPLFIFFPSGVPFPPTNLKINEETCINRTTVLKWTTTASNDAPILHFLIEQESNHEPDVFIFLHNVTNPNATSVVLNLTGWSTLRFRMRAVNSFGPSRPSLPTGAGICKTSQSGVFVFLCANAAVNCRACARGSILGVWVPISRVKFLSTTYQATTAVSLDRNL